MVLDRGQFSRQLKKRGWHRDARTYSVDDLLGGKVFGLVRMFTAQFERHWLECGEKETCICSVGPTW